MRRIILLLAIVAFAAPAVWAQTKTPAKAPKPAPGLTDEVLSIWKDEGRKIIAMAEDFPEAKYDYKPTPEVRSFAEQLLHIGGGNYLFLKAAKGEKWTAEDGSPARKDYPTKAAVVAFVKKSFADVEAYIRSQGDAGLAKPIKEPFENRMIPQSTLWMEYATHPAEHYGQLVVYYRLNGIVPPESRPRK